MLTSLRELRLLVVGSGRCYQFDLVLPLPSIDGRINVFFDSAVAR